MSEDNMEELRRHRIRQPGQVIDPCSEGEWVRFSDVQEREAQNARIRKVAAQVVENACLGKKLDPEGYRVEDCLILNLAAALEGRASFLDSGEESNGSLAFDAAMGDRRNEVAMLAEESNEGSIDFLSAEDRARFTGRATPSPALQPEPGLIGVCSHDDQNWWQADKSLFCPEDNPYCDPVFYRRCAADTGEAD